MYGWTALDIHKHTHIFGAIQKEAKSNICLQHDRKSDLRFCPSCNILKYEHQSKSNELSIHLEFNRKIVPTHICTC